MTFEEMKTELAKLSFSEREEILRMLFALERADAERSTAGSQEVPNADDAEE